MMAYACQLKGMSESHPANVKLVSNRNKLAGNTITVGSEELFTNWRGRDCPTPGVDRSLRNILTDGSPPNKLLQFT